MYYCNDIIKLFNLLEGCCDSCHDDWGEGYDTPLEIENPDTGEVIAMVCCYVINSLLDKYPHLKSNRGNMNEKEFVRMIKEKRLEWLIFPLQEQKNDD